MIYLLEDDKSIRELVTYTLNAQNIEAKGFEKPSEFYAELKNSIPDMVILDIMLPEESGLDILRKIRGEKRTAYLPIMMLTAKSSEYDKVIGLDAGADDYMVKPFGMMELVARAKALLRRTEQKDNKEKELTIGELKLYHDKHTVKVGDDKISLTYKEYELLHLLMSNKDIVYTRPQLLDKIWGFDFEGETRTVDVHIRTLRQKLGKSARYIRTVHGVGYKLGDNDE